MVCCLPLYTLFFCCMNDNMIKILSIFGTRPEAIKFAPVLLALSKDPRFKSCVVVTAQHRQMLDQVLKLFNITPDHDLNIMKKDQTLNHVLSAALEGLSSVIEMEKPDIILVQGDTTTAFAGAIAGYHARIPVGHIEAGLRTGDLYAPFPEEGNRQMISRIASLHFAPTERKRETLISEGVVPSSVSVTGNTGIDTLQWIVNENDNDAILNQAKGLFSPALLSVVESDAKILLVTGHRRENHGRGFEQIAEALKEIVNTHADVVVVYPVHPNPKVLEPMRVALGDTPRILLIDPLDYHPFVTLMKRSHIILTDSGGVQEEAPSVGKPVLVLREKTERPEAVAAGTALLVGTDKEMILAALNRLLDDADYYENFGKITNPFGDGKASGRIIEILNDFGHK